MTLVCPSLLPTKYSQHWASSYRIPTNRPPSSVVSLTKQPKTTAALPMQQSRNTGLHQAKWWAYGLLYALPQHTTPCPIISLVRPSKQTSNQHMEWQCSLLLSSQMTLGGPFLLPFLSRVWRDGGLLSVHTSAPGANTSP
jgi:hypothetical protein